MAQRIRTTSELSELARAENPARLVHARGHGVARERQVALQALLAHALHVAQVLDLGVQLALERRLDAGGAAALLAVQLRQLLADALGHAVV